MGLDMSNQERISKHWNKCLLVCTCQSRKDMTSIGGFIHLHTFTTKGQQLAWWLELMPHRRFLI